MSGTAMSSGPVVRNTVVRNIVVSNTVSTSNERRTF
jgi:hypothetical protein